MVVAQQYQKFMQYRGKVSALRIASEEVGQAFSSMDSFSADNRHLLRRGGISQSMANLILRGEKRIPGMIKDLIGELDKELAELDKFLGKTNSMSVETFKLFQKSVLSHQHKQSVILKALYEMGVNFFHSIDGQIHARHETMEKSHVEFGQHVLSLFEVLSQGYKDKGTIAEHWSDALEYLILFLKDENELGLSQETIAHFVNSDTHPFPRYILSRYYHTQAGRRGFVDKLHKAGFRRPAIVEGDTKKIKYVDLSEDKQKEVDKIIKESLLYLLDGSGDPFIPNSSPGSVFYWDGGDSNKEYSFKHIIENEVYKGDSKITKDQIKVLHQLLQEFKVKVLIGACKRMFRFTDEKEKDSLGYNSFRIAQSDWDNTIITVGNFYDKKFYENDKNETNIKSMITLLTQILDEKKPEKHSYVVTLLEDKHNETILYKKEGGDGDGDDEKATDAEFKNLKDYIETILVQNSYDSETVGTIWQQIYDCFNLGTDDNYSESFEKYIRKSGKEITDDLKTRLTQLSQRIKSAGSNCNNMEEMKNICNLIKSILGWL